jgi:hypothetical protein
MVTFKILQVPLFYCLTVLILTHALKRQIVCWFEHILYIDEDDEEEEEHG